MTAVFADLVGSTARAERLDPEDVRALLAPFHARVRAELERFGGTVEKFIGDAVVALFGAPVAHEDDPERAVRAALAVQDAIAELNEGDPRLALEVRVGVATGEALVALDADPAAGEGLAAGDVLNTAARLQAAAPPGAVLVGESTARASAHAIEYEAVAPVDARGKARPVLARRALAPRSRLGVDVRQHGAAPLVGRRRELELVLAALERARSEREAQLVTLVGVPGIGKSRLVWEALRAVDAEPEPTTWRQGRCLPYGDGVTFWAVGEMVKAHAGILDTDTAAEVGRKLRETVAALAPDESGRLEGLLRPLVGLAGEHAVAVQPAEAFAAWRRFFEAIAERGPLVLVFEDVHWADELVLDFVEHLVDWARGVPILVLCTARPELLERRAGWGGGALNALTIALSPLSEEETRALVGALGGERLDEAARAAVLANAAGNPLYAEQFVRMVADRGDEAAALPETVQGIVAARIDALGPDEKGVLHRAAVIGKVFWTGAVVALGGGEREEVERLLHRLERKEFVRRERRSSVGAEAEHAFRHALVRDVAYGQIPRAERSRLHAGAAGWIEGLSERAEDLAELRAHHWLNAADLARAAGLDAGPLERSARTALVDAGERAFGLGAFGAAERAFAAALELWPDDGSAERAVLRARRLRVLHDLGAALRDVLDVRDELVRHGLRGHAAAMEMVANRLAFDEGRPDNRRRHRERALELLAGEPPTPEVLFALGVLARSHITDLEPEEGLARAARLLELAEQAGDEHAVLEALTTVATCRGQLGDEEGFEGLAEAARRAEAAGSLQVIRAYKNAGSLRVDQGRLADGFALQAAGLRAAERLGVPYEVTWFTGERAVERWWRGRWDDALADAEAVLAAAAEAPHYMEVVGLWIRGLVRLERGDVPGALADSGEALRLSRRHGGQVAVFPRTGRLLACLAAGGEAEAHALADEVAAGGMADWASGMHAAFAALGRGEELLALPPTRYGAWEEAGRAYLRGDHAGAAARYAAIGSLPDEADARLRAGEALLRAGDPAGRAEVERALAFWRSVGAARRVAEAEAALAASGVTR